MPLQIIIFSLFISLSGNCFAKQSTQVLNFANHLYQKHDYYRAITEYKRHQFLNPKSAKHNQIGFQIGFAYLMGKKWEAATPYFQKLLVNFPNKQIGQEAHFALAQTHFLSRKYPYALIEWQHFIDKYPRHKLVSNAHYQKAWSYFYKQQIAESQGELSKIRRDPPIKSGDDRASLPQDDRIGLKAQALSTEISKWHELPQRSALLAGTLSAILPGMGQWYAGRFWDGMSALVVNSMFGYGVYATFRDKHYVAAGILTFITTGFYGGNIFSAASSAYKYNWTVKRNTWKRLEKKYGLKVDWTGSQLRFQF